MSSRSIAPKSRARSLQPGVGKRNHERTPAALNLHTCPHLVARQPRRRADTGIMLLTMSGLAWGEAGAFRRMWRGECGGLECGELDRGELDCGELEDMRGGCSEGAVGGGRVGEAAANTVS